MNPRREQIEAAVAQFLARGGEIQKPASRPLQIVVTRDRRGRTSRRWAATPPSMGTLSAKSGPKTPPRKPT